MINLTFTGDFAPNKPLFDEVNANYFSDLMPFLENADLNSTNLECPIIEEASKADKYGPSLATDARAIPLLQQGKFHLVTLANNHIMDHGAKGLSSTLDKLEAASISYVGAGNNHQAATLPFIYSKNNVKLGILNVAENEFSNTTDENPGAAPLDLIDNANAIRELKNQVDVVIVIVHGGAELHEYPSPRFKKTLRFMADQGANVVLAHHTHKYNGYEVYKNVPIFYGLGNFVFPSQTLTDRSWSLGVLLAIKINTDLSISFQTIPFLQNYSHYGIHVLKDEELRKFREDEAQKNKIILDDKALSSEYEVFYKKVEKQYLHFLQPYTSKYLHKLFSLGIIPSFLKNSKKRLLYLNLIRCEAHRDIILKLLK
ncbi:CapA family protein [Flavobacterium sp.]|uniref:CapA family protein n=2 Tax=Flavobacterium sp. TaxID=239 RepID=UPI0040474B19